MSRRRSSSSGQPPPARPTSPPPNPPDLSKLRNPSSSSCTTPTTPATSGMFSESDSPDSDDEPDPDDDSLDTSLLLSAGLNSHQSIQSFPGKLSPPTMLSPPPRAPRHPPKPPDTSTPVNLSFYSSIAQTVLGFSSELDPLVSVDEPDPYVISLVSLLLFAVCFSRKSKWWLPLKFSLPSRESWIGSVTSSVNFRWFLLLIVINICSVHPKINKIPAFKALGSYCAIHSPLRCSPLRPFRSLQNQQLESISPPLTMPSCARRCCLFGCFPGTEARRSFNIECVHWSSLVSPFDCLLGLETRRSFNRFPPLWSESFRHSLAMCILESVAVVAIAWRIKNFGDMKIEDVKLGDMKLEDVKIDDWKLEEMSLLSYLWMKRFTQSIVAVVAVQAPLLIRSLLRFEESLKLDFKMIKIEVFFFETVWIFFTLSFIAYVYVLVLEPRASEIWMTLYVTR